MDDEIVMFMKKNPTNKAFNTSIPTQVIYKISSNGIEFVENGFKKNEVYAFKTIFNINGGVVNFGTIHNLNANYIEELKAIIPESNVRDEIEKYFKEIKAVTSEENINGRLHLSRVIVK